MGIQVVTSVTLHPVPVTGTTDQGICLAGRASYDQIKLSVPQQLVDTMENTVQCIVLNLDIDNGIKNSNGNLIVEIATREFPLKISDVF